MVSKETLKNKKAIDLLNKNSATQRLINVCAAPYAIEYRIRVLTIILWRVNP